MGDDATTSLGGRGDLDPAEDVTSPVMPAPDSHTSSAAPSGNVSAVTDPQARRQGDPGRLGRYTIKRVLGEGGMGTVYLAEQENPRREVALKVIRAGYLAPELLRRFELESQVLGRLQHPGIAQIYEAGVFHDDTPHADDESSSRRASSLHSVTSPLRHSVTSPSPIPFFAMEFIRGVPLTDYADAKHLGTRQRLELLAKVCDAVYHAHQKGVIHRDLKPGNILVVDEVPSSHSVTPSLRHSVTSPVGQPKILDFGVARATDSDIQQTTMQTDVGQLIGTVPYMSPEQVTGDPNELDTRSDVYALGVIAYELLAGRLPHDLRRKMIHEAARIIREEEPTRLSSINRTLGGDVETIVAKALEKEKTRRYQSAESLASDIRRYLKDEPIAARPASTWYQAAKFAKRNKGLVTGLGAAFVLLIAGVIGTSIGLGQAVRARDAESVARKEADTQRDAAVAAKSEEEKQRKVAEAQRDKAEKIADFMSDTLEGAGPKVAKGRDITMLKEMMDAAAARIEKGELKAAPEAEARLRLTIGSVYRQLSLFKSAVPMLKPALVLARSLEPGGGPLTADALQELGGVSMEQGELAEAESALRESLDLRQRLFTKDNFNVADTLNNLALVCDSRGQSSEAERLARDSLAMKRRLAKGDDPGIAVSLGNLASLLRKRGALEEAESAAREGLDMNRRLHRGDHPDVEASLSHLAWIRYGRGDLAGAESLYREALDMARRLYPGPHVRTQLEVSDLASVLADRGDEDGAMRYYREALDMCRRLYPPDHPQIATLLVNMATVARENAEAESLAFEGLDMWRRLCGEKHPSVAHAERTIGMYVRNRGDIVNAERLFRESADGYGATLGNGHWRTADARMFEAGALYRQGRLAEAAPVFLGAWYVLESSPDAPANKRTDCLEAMITLYTQWAKADPGKGYDAKAAEWKTKLESIK